jgi:hypothetical protein
MATWTRTWRHGRGNGDMIKDMGNIDEDMETRTRTGYRKQKMEAQAIFRNTFTVWLCANVLSVYSCFTKQSNKHRWTRLLTQQLSITVYRLPRKANFCFPFPFAANKRNLAVSVFRLQVTYESWRFLLVPFSVCSRVT